MRHPLSSIFPALQVSRQRIFGLSLSVHSWIRSRYFTGYEFFVIMTGLISADGDTTLSLISVLICRNFMSAIDVSVIIPVKRLNENVERTISALEKGSYNKYEIIVVVDQKSSQKFSKTTLMVCFEGPAEKRDEGGRRAKGNVLAFVD